MNHNDYYVVLLGGRMDDGEKLAHIKESGALKTAADMVAYAQENAQGFSGDTYIVRVCRDGQSIDMVDLIYNHINHTFYRPEWNIDKFQFRDVEMTVPDAIKYIEQRLLNGVERKKYDN